jgi:hypothetical protein
MTQEEEARLKVGDRVEALYQSFRMKRRKQWRLVEIIAIHSIPMAPKILRFTVRPLTSPRRLVRRYKQHLRPAPDCERAHVYADYLEEEGYADAAAALRKRFPL